MDLAAKKAIVRRFLQERRQLMPRRGILFLELLLGSGPLGTMHFCTEYERARLRDSVLVMTEVVSVWAVMLGNEPDRAEARARLSLEQLDLTPPAVIDRLRDLPVWFLCIDEPYRPRRPRRAADVERAALSLPNAPALRRTALLDQLDAALDERDWTRVSALRSLLFG
jgi:hypothetical protein